MIQHKVGDLLSVQSGYIIHGCNAQGVMGSGVALQIKRRRPAAYHAYMKAHEGFLSAGKSMLGTNSFAVCNVTNRVIINAVTQEFYGTQRQQTDYNAVRSCFRHVNEMITQDTFPDVPKEVNFPLIGCGLGGGDWEVVSQIIDEELDDSFTKVLWTLE